jgi:hypothetical protein
MYNQPMPAASIQLCARLRQEARLGVETYRLSAPFGYGIFCVIIIIAMCCWWVDLGAESNGIDYKPIGVLTLFLLLACGLFVYSESNRCTLEHLQALTQHFRQTLAGSGLLAQALLLATLKDLPDLSSPGLQAMLLWPFPTPTAKPLTTSEGRIYALIRHYRFCCHRLKLTAFPSGSNLNGEMMAPPMISWGWYSWHLFGTPLARIVVQARHLSLNADFRLPCGLVDSALRLAIADELEQAGCLV